MKIFSDAAALNEAIVGLTGRKIVFTNGVFDLLHPGHIELLEFARDQGDFLIVGVNDDASVRRLKGEKRPIFPLPERLEVLAAIRFVDAVIPFAEDTPLELIRSLRRLDVLVKGGDYAPDEVVGRAEVEAWGGKLVIFPFRTASSTSSIIERISQP